MKAKLGEFEVELQRNYPRGRQDLLAVRTTDGGEYRVYAGNPADSDEAERRSYVTAAPPEGYEAVAVGPDGPDAPEAMAWVRPIADTGEGDYFVKVLVPLRVRVENAAGHEDAIDTALDYIKRDPITGNNVLHLIAGAIDPTAFYQDGPVDVLNAAPADAYAPVRD